jgi:hypothetical protein
MLRKIIGFVFVPALLTLFIGTAHLLPANASTSPYGINAHLAANNVLQKTKDAGIKWVRIDINWFAVEKTMGNFDYTDVDRVVDFADANDLSILAVLAYTPGWANGNKGINYPADNVYYWKYFVQETVVRYNTAIKYWCIWNEPNAKDFFEPGKDVFVEKVFEPAAEIIRGTDPAAFIVGPELSHLTSQDREWYFWMTYILSQSGQYIDILSHHIYKLEGPAHIYELLEQGDHLIPPVKDVIADAGHAGKPFWITETGWHTNEVSEQEQGNKYLEMLQKRKEKNYPQKIFFYEIIDDPTPGIQPWGILRSNLSEKPAYTVYKDFIAGMYDNSPGSGDNEKKKKCFARSISPDDSRGRRQVSHTLSNLRGLRDHLKYLFPPSGKLIDLYYQMSPRFLELALTDSRVYRLSRELMDTIANAAAGNPAAYLNREPDQKTLQNISRLISLLKEKKTSPFFQKILPWAEKQINLLQKEKITLNHYFSHYLAGETRDICRSNEK